MTLTFFVRKYLLFALASCCFLLIAVVSPGLAHHPFGMGDGSDLSVWQSLVSGVGHPLLGPDHLLFMLGIALLGLKSTKRWVLPLLAFGLGGSAFAQLQPLPYLLTPWIEAIVSLSLAIEGCIVLNFLSSKWLLPMFALHGYLLGNTIVGVESTPLIGYFVGLFLGQGSLLLLVTAASQKVINSFDVNRQNVFAGIWIGIGVAFSWVALIQ
ncbi:HupE/UreJ family protein [Prochlorococcus sp. MIT 1223]|uniref:HupE/UreJ family protein n=1 Tax=Prochlorococcus sp. MIT 1223 TaxID=3096217 RepID=UPI002A7521AD|nr:HupE/UreJ family protein [Prochlorococcus sp. MIT 1223]